MLVRVNGLMLGKFMSTLNPALHLKLPVDARNGARNVLVGNNLNLLKLKRANRKLSEEQLRNTAAAMDVQKYYLSEIGFPICMGKWAILHETCYTPRENRNKCKNIVKVSLRQINQPNKLFSVPIHVVSFLSAVKHPWGSWKYNKKCWKFSQI